MPITLTQTFPKPSSVTLTDIPLMREIGLQAIRAIQARTRQGRDATGRAFAPYSASYAKAKAQAVGGSSAPNLTLSGDMLNALQIVEVTATSVTLGWTR
jgi:hypothetical protein